MISIARRNLMHSKLKLATALIGVAFSVLLVTCFVGLYLACARHSSGLVQNAGADLWVMAPGTRSVDLGEPISIRRLYQAMAVDGVGSFTTIPYVFTSHQRAENYTPVTEGLTTFVAVKCTPDSLVETVQGRLKKSLPSVEVLTSEQFTSQTRSYWLFGTGIGACIIFTAVLGLIVGCVVVSQTIYSSTLSRLAEYGTLKAMGMSNPALARIVLEQALLLGLVSYAVGIGLVLAVAHQTASTNLNIDTPPWLLVVMLLVTLATCAAASVTSVVKVFRLPPASVFRS